MCPGGCIRLYVNRGFCDYCGVDDSRDTRGLHGVRGDFDTRYTHVNIYKPACTYRA